MSFSTDEKLFYISDDLKKFFNTLDKESSTLTDCDLIMKEASSFVASSLNLGKIEVIIEANESRYLPKGIHYHSDLYSTDSVGSEFSEVKNKLISDGNVIVKIYNSKDEPFTSKVKDVVYIISNAISKQYTKALSNQVMINLINTDLDTGAKTLNFLMRDVAIKLQTRQIENYFANFFNIHNFKYANKLFSYAEGDIILKNYTADVISHLDNGEILARMGGDNFVALIKKENENKFIDYIQEVHLDYKNERKEQHFIFGATIGYAPLVGIETARDVMARVSIAYQFARRQGAGSVSAYSDKIMQEIMQRQSVLSNFKTALVNEEFVVYYQPKVNINDKSIYGAEALVRWFRKGTLVPPIDFIPFLEQEGSICQLDYYVLEKTCAFLKNRIDSGKEPLCISVNFSRRHLEESDLIEHIVKIIDKYGIDHKYIEIELTESEDYQNFEVLTNIVDALSSNGISTSMDDFGTGFSSLNMIKNVDLKVIKIDKSFIPLETEYPGKEKDFMMFNNIVSLIKNLGKHIVVEGVETPKQLQFMKDAGCDIVQGYIFDKPLPEVDFIERLENGYKED